MAEVSIDMIKAAGKDMLRWRKVYNSLCRVCQRKLFISITQKQQDGTQSMVNASNDVLANQLCSSCRSRMKVILGG